MVTRKKTRWVDGSTDPNPAVFVTRNELERLGVKLDNPNVVGDLIDKNELTRLRLTTVYRQTNDQPRQGYDKVGWWLFVLVVAIHLLGLVWVYGYKPDPDKTTGNKNQNGN